MELKKYLQVLLKHWWIVVPVFLVTLTATTVFTFNQIPIYSSRATFVVAPSAAFQDVKSFATGLDTLSRRTEIAETYSEVASSRTIRNAALDKLGLSPEQRQNLSIQSQLVAGTNILRITVEAPDPEVARDVANAVGAEVIAYAKNLYEPFVLSPLDQATLRLRPIKPAKGTNMILGAVFGLVLGAGLAFLAEYLGTPLEAAANMTVIDTRTGVYKKSYFMQRLGVEMARAKRQHYPLSVVLLNVDQAGTLQATRSPGEMSEILRKMALVLKQYLREEDLIAHFGDTTFALLLPDLPGDAVKAMMEKLQMRLSWTPFDLERSGVRINLTSIAGVSTLDQDSLERDELIAQASRALHLAGTNGYSRTHQAAEGANTQHGGAAQNE
jgi:diguanylate cyclase (GGDEF)-like protein